MNNNCSGFTSYDKGEPLSACCQTNEHADEGVFLEILTSRERMIKGPCFYK